MRSWVLTIPPLKRSPPKTNLNKTFPTTNIPTIIEVIEPEIFEALVSLSGVRDLVKWLAKCIAVGEPCAISSLKLRIISSGGMPSLDCCFEICFFDMLSVLGVWAIFNLVWVDETVTDAIRLLLQTGQSIDCPASSSGISKFWLHFGQVIFKA